MQTIIQKAFKPFKLYLPPWISNPIRNVFTAILTPILFSYRTGHFLSTFKMAAVSRNGEPSPWYTYPVIDFLKYRTYDDKTVLEFGGGQSTLWWAKRAKFVLTLEGDKKWYEKIKDKIPANVDLHYISMASRSVCTEQVEEILSSKPYSTYDVVIIDGLYRQEMMKIARRIMTETGAIICDNAEGYDFYESFKESGLNRVDFFGNVPGVVLPQCTSVFFKSSSFLFSARHPIPAISQEK